MVQLIHTIIKRMINLRSLLASTAKINLQGPNMLKYSFVILLFLFSIKDMCLFNISYGVANPEYVA